MVKTGIRWLVLAGVAVMLACSCGCSMKYWGGEMAGEQPGVHFRMPSLFAQGEFTVTSDCNAKVKSAKYTTPTKTAAGGFELSDAEFGQTPSTSLKELPAVLPLLPAIQKTQVEYAKVWADCVSSIADSVCAALSPFLAISGSKTRSGISLELPNGFKIGGQPVQSVDDFKAALQQIMDEVQQLKALRPPTTADPASAPK